MASSQLISKDNPNGNVADHDHAADTTSSDNESQHADGLNNNVAAHVSDADDTFSSNKDEPAEEAKYSNPVNGHLSPRPSYGPPDDLIDGQQGKMKWVPCYSSVPDPKWVEDINVAGIRYMVGKHIHHLGLDKDDFEIEYFAEGSFNKLYTIRKASQPPGIGPEYIFRACLPAYPWYKLESEIATMELVRMYTDIPVPKVYVYDTEAYNEVQYEWMIVDKVKGIPFGEAREAMDMEQKTKLAHTLADWMHQLSTLRFDKIGSIYRRRQHPATIKDDFKVGPIIDQTFMADWRLEYKLYCGTYTSIEHFLRAIVDANLADATDPRQKQRSEFCAAINELKWLTTDPDDCNSGWDREMATKLQRKWASKPRREKDIYINQVRAQITSYRAHNDDDVDAVAHERPRYHLTDARGDRVSDPFPKMSVQCRALLFAIPHLCPADALPASSAVLHHWDVSGNNVLVDADSGAAVALVDWEQVHTLPYALIDPYPSAIYDKYDMTTPPRPLAPNASECMTSTWKANFEFYENSLLRKAFRERLEELRSPHLEAFEEGEPDLKDLLSLARHADQLWVKKQVKELVEKVEEKLGWGF